MKKLDLKTPKTKNMNWFVRLLTLNKAAAITLAPFGIYLKPEYKWNMRVINEEKIHWEQQLEMWYVFFYLIYFIEWVIKLFIYGRRSYYNISFEREAKYNVRNFDYYLKIRKKFGWRKYIFR